jgi:integrase
MDVASIDTPLVVEILTPIWTTKTVTAKLVRGRIEAVISYAKVVGYIQGDRINPAQWKGHLSLILANSSKIQKRIPHASLPYENIGEFMKTLRNQGAFSAKALEFLILTGGRTGEVLESVWNEIEGDVWVIPGNRMKGGVQHRVPLSEAALSVLVHMKPVQNSEYIFPGRARNRPMSNMTLLKLLERMGIAKDVAVTHGFRSTFRTWVAEKTSVAHEVGESAISHKGTVLVETYRRTDFLDIRRKLMAEWADFCGQTFTSPNVVSIHAKH